MQTLALKKEDWKTVLDHLSRAPKEQTVSLEIRRENPNASQSSEKAAFGGLSYDPEAAVLSIRVGAVDHLLRDPLKISLIHRLTDIISVKIIARDMARYLITFLPPLHLPDLLRSFFPIHS